MPVGQQLVNRINLLRMRRAPFIDQLSDRKDRLMVRLLLETWMMFERAFIQTGQK
jgi:hypothetical protein